MDSKSFCPPFDHKATTGRRDHGKQRKDYDRGIRSKLNLLYDPGLQISNSVA